MKGESGVRACGKSINRKKYSACEGSEKSLLAHGWQVCAASDTPALWCNRAGLPVTHLALLIIIPITDGLDCGAPSKNRTALEVWPESLPLTSPLGRILFCAKLTTVASKLLLMIELSSHNCIWESQGHYETGRSTVVAPETLSKYCPKLHHQYANHGRVLFIQHCHRQIISAQGRGTFKKEMT